MKKVNDFTYKKCYDVAKKGLSKVERGEAFGAIKDELMESFTEEELEEQEESYNSFELCQEKNSDYKDANIYYHKGECKRNLKTLAPSSNVKLSLGNWWEPLQRWWGSFDLVLSNPPYIPSDLIKDLEPVVKNHEPHIALDGGADGMIASKQIIIGASNGLAKGGWLILEHHYDQSEKIIQFMHDQGMEEVSFEKDLSGIKRYAICRKK